MVVVGVEESGAGVVDAVVAVVVMQVLPKLVVQKLKQVVMGLMVVMVAQD